jgi:hypothetical protein
MRGLRRRLQSKKQVKKQVAKQIADATGPAGPPGAARAYAAVGAHFFNPCTGGTGGDECTFSQSKGITSVTRQSTGTYCVTAPGISSADVAAAVTVDWSNSNNPEGNASAMTSEVLDACSAGEFEVHTDRHSVMTVDQGGGPTTCPRSGQQPRRTTWRSRS